MQGVSRFLGSALQSEGQIRRYYCVFIFGVFANKIVDEIRHLSEQLWLFVKQRMQHKLQTNTKEYVGIHN